MPRSKRYKPDYFRLCGAIRRSNQALEATRRLKREAVSEFAGVRWGNNQGKKNDPANLMYFYVSTIARMLISRNPRAMLATFDHDLREVVESMQTWMNERIKKMGFARTAQKIGIDALFGPGFGKVALAGPADAAAKSWKITAGLPFFERIGLDDMFFDSSANDWDECDFIGNTYWTHYAAVMDNKMYNRAARARLTPTTRKDYNQQGDERTETLGRGTFSWDEDFNDKVQLCEVYLPHHRRVDTMSADDVMAGCDKYDEPLLKQQWIGPDAGPYHVLGFGSVPDSPMPPGPGMLLIELHKTYNSILRKQIRKARDQKDLTFALGSEQDAVRFRDASDGEVLRCEAPDKIKLFSSQGPNQNLERLGMDIYNKFSGLGGGLELLAGIAPQSKTAAQDKMLNENSSRMVTDMQDEMVTYTAKVIEALGWYWIRDPKTIMKTNYQIPGMPDLSVPITITPEDRRRIIGGEVDIRVDPFSLPHQSPQQRAAFLTQILNQMAPMMPLLQQQGIALNLRYYLQKMAEYGDQPDLAEMFEIQNPPGMEPGSAAGEVGMPPSTERSYIRRSESNGNDEQMMEMANAAAEGGAQFGEIGEVA